MEYWASWGNFLEHGDDIEEVTIHLSFASSGARTDNQI